MFDLPAWYWAVGEEYSEHRPRRSLMAMTSWIWASENPLGSMMHPEESENDKTEAPNSRHFIAANWATLPDPEIRTFLPKIF